MTDPTTIKTFVHPDVLLHDMPSTLKCPVFILENTRCIILTTVDGPLLWRGFSQMISCGPSWCMLAGRTGRKLLHLMTSTFQRCNCCCRLPTWLKTRLSGPSKGISSLAVMTPTSSQRDWCIYRWPVSKKTPCIPDTGTCYRYKDGLTVVIINKSLPCLLALLCTSISTAHKSLLPTVTLYYSVMPDMSTC